MVAAERVRHDAGFEVLRILHVAAPAPAGGLEQVVRALAAGHRARGHDVAVAALLIEGQAPHPLVAALESDGVRVFVAWTKHRDYAAERSAVARFCAEFEPDVVHTHGYRPDVLHRSVAARMGLPTVTTVHGPSFIGGLKGAFYEWLQRRAYRRFDAVIAVSEPLYAETLAGGVRAERLHMLPNAWSSLYTPLSRQEARRELGLPLDEPVVGWVGRLIPVKGCDVFLDAWSRLPEPRPIASIIGYGFEEEALRLRVADLGATERVRFHTGVNDAGRLFAAFDTYVLSSRSEGLPIVLLEALAAGTPAVATAVGGVPHVLREQAGWVVPPDDAEALAAAIRVSLSDRAEAEVRAARATARLKNEFALEPWLAQHERIYEAIAR